MVRKICHFKPEFQETHTLTLNIKAISLLVARRIILLVAFDFLLQNFGRWRGFTNDILSC